MGLLGKFKKFKNAKNEEELGDFVDFLCRISEKKRGENKNAVYGNLKMYFIGNNDVLKKYGVAPHLNRIEHDMQNGVNVFYILSLGSYHTAAAFVLSELLQEKKIAQVDTKYVNDININGKKIKTAIIRMVGINNCRCSPNLLPAT
jgi:hypothetical protein